jgi:hypothetical protein
MSESPNKTANEKELQDAIERAREAVLDAVTKYGEAVLEFAWSKGFDKGWDSGWEKGREHLMSAIRKGFSSADEHKPSPAPPAVSAPSIHGTAQLSLLPPTKSASESVYDWIARFPGRRGYEIAQGLRHSYPERTVRTALHRLKNVKIKNVNGQWYTVEAAPADSLNESTEGS